MILPDKHIRVAESLLGLGSYVLSCLTEPMTLDRIWSDFDRVNNTDKFPAYHTFDNLVLAIDLLFSIGALNQDDDGRLFRCDSSD